MIGYVQPTFSRGKKLYRGIYNWLVWIFSDKYIRINWGGHMRYAVNPDHKRKKEDK